MNFEGQRLEYTIMRRISVLDVKRYDGHFAILYFKDRYAYRSIPGQYVMIWVPGCDEIPLSVSHAEDGVCAVTVKNVGEATSRLCNFNVGEQLGIRGPFGRGFKCIGVNPLIVAGGVGVAGLRLLLYKFIRKSVVPTLVVGTKTFKENIFHEEFLKLSKNNLLVYYPVTEDGSLGERGLASEVAEKLISLNDYDQVYCCGNEKMLYNMFNIVLDKKFGAQFSLERYIKCAVGICGQCVLDDEGLLVCKDGPVFSKNVLRRIKDFGHFSRNSSGKKFQI
ncbi:MAG: dihydroorotate dehydrogenase electron transfer subunit [Nitrososphaeria archaeon]|nr:dihydroorotate dehydrogenase electron transfer subunit [Nitrososphaeria archaeon]